MGLTYRPQLRCFFAHRPCDRRPFHFSFRIDNLQKQHVSMLSTVIPSMYFVRSHALDLLVSYRTTTSLQTRAQTSLPVQVHQTGQKFSLTTPALSSKYKYTPSLLRQGLLCLTTTAGMTFFLSSGFPFLTVAMTISPTPAAGRRLSRAPMPLTEMM